MAPENYRCYQSNFLPEIASMRPGLDGPGKRCVEWIEQNGFMASMRPGLDGPGKPTRQFHNALG